MILGGYNKKLNVKGVFGNQAQILLFIIIYQTLSFST